VKRIEIVAGILCGGASRRMGQDKARLPHPSGGTLLERAVALAGAACDDVLLLSGDGRRYPDLGLTELPDAMADSGPLGGLVAGLRHVRPAALLLYPVDMAGLEAAQLEVMAECFRKTGGPLVARGESRRHPALSIWGGSSLPALEEALTDGRLALHPLLDAASARELPLPSATLVNWNRPEDLEG